MVNLERERVLSKATGDILKAIYALLTPSLPSLPALPEQVASGASPVALVALPSDIAARTGTSRAFVTKMLQTMDRQGLVEYARYRGVRLTDDGRRSAVELLRHHRLLERFLTDALGFSARGAHEEAERLEHVISEEFEARLDAYLNHPSTCPHGAPIPTAEETLLPSMTTTGKHP